MQEDATTHAEDSLAVGSEDSLAAGSEDSLAAEGPAFPFAVKVLATLFMGALVFWGLRASGQILAAEWSATGLGVLVTGVAVVLLCYYWILRSRTAVDHQGLRQTWMWRKQVDFADVTQVKLIAVPHLEWLVAPRLVLRTRGGGMQVFHAADLRVLRGALVRTSTERV